VASALGAAAGARAADSALIVYRITEEPVPFGETDECPMGGGIATMRSPGGREIGTSRLCVQSEEFACEPVCVLRRVGTLTNTFAGGQILVDVSFRDTFNETFSRAIHSANGTVTGGTGVYSGSSGWLMGGGLIGLDPDFTAHPNLVYAIRVR
jgi:hypothetical protein